MNDIAIGIDIGGTKIAFAAADRDGNILATHTEPTLANEGVPAVIGRIAQGVARVRAQLPADQPLAGIGMGVPGAVVDGVAQNAVNLGWRDVPLVASVRAAIDLDVPVWAQNDVKIMAIAEGIFGAARGVRDFIFLALGTGLGGGAISNGRLVNGASGFAMEMGHISLDPHGRACNCGGIGCAEMYISGKGMLAGANAHLAAYPQSSLATGAITTHAIIDAARAGDPLACLVIDEAVEALGEVMAFCVAVLDPTLIVLGGGLGQAESDLVYARATDAMRSRLFPDLRGRIDVQPSQVESSALGAAALVWHELAVSA